MPEIVLTKEQQAVVNDRGGALLVSAAAGSGKTKVLVDRVLSRVADPAQRCNVDDFLMITFTQAAAAELRGKLIAALSELLAQKPDDRHLQRQMSRVYLAQISTVHAFCGTLLREYAHVLELPADFRVCDEEEAAQLRMRALTDTLEDAYHSVGEVPKLAAALDMLGAGRDDRAIHGLILGLYSGVQCYADPSARVEALRKLLDVSACDDAGQTVWGEYLISEFQRYLTLCACSLRAACKMIEETPSLAPYLPTFNANVLSIEELAQETTWEGIRTKKFDSGRLSSIRKCDAPEKKDYVQELRKSIANGVRAAQEKFILPSETALADLKLSGSALEGLLLLVADFSERYRRSKLQRHVLDYNDLEHDTLRLLRSTNGITAAARELSQRYVEIMVDEYQDTNAVQDSIFSAISKDGRNLFFVGDVKQSIYRFRLADPGIFLKKYQEFVDYTEEREGEPRKILLSDNFRSHPAVLEAANAVFRLTMTERTGGLLYGDAEALHANRPNTDLGEPPVELHCIDMQNVPKQPPVERGEIEAEFVARRIEALLQDSVIPEGEGLRAIRPDDIVILMRSPAKQGTYYLDALRRRGIAAVSGGDDLFSAEEIHFLIAFLRVIDNPRQDIPLLTVLLSPVFGFTAEDLAELRVQERSAELYDALCASQRATEFCALLNTLRELSQRVHLRELLEEISERTLLRAVYASRLEPLQCARELDAFFALADRFEAAGRYSLNGFLRYLDALDEKNAAATEASAAGAVRLMSIHKSKGLEFPVVILADLCKGFNHTDARANVLSDSALGLGASVFDTRRRISYPTIAKSAISAHIDRENVSEEMRILYVAMTRAKYRLIMTCCDRNLVSRLKSISRDLEKPAPALLVESAACLADWVLMTALTRTEAGALFAAAGNSGCSEVQEMPWRITMNNGMNYLPEVMVAEERETANKFTPELFREMAYLHDSATSAPTKLTATQLKGRSLDEEAAEQTRPKELLHFERPRFAEGELPLSPTERGTAIHLAMQFVRYENCATLAGVRSELERLGTLKMLTVQQLAAVAPEKLLRFFTSELGDFVRRAPKVVREFKFSILEDAAIYDASLAGEKVLLQGVTDCCVLEPDGLTILDFKSDHIKSGEEARRAEIYRGQLDAYARALSRIFELPVKRRILYFFATDTALSV